LDVVERLVGFSIERKTGGKLPQPSLKREKILFVTRPEG